MPKDMFTHEAAHISNNKETTCSMTSGAIQHGVPTNVCLTVSRVWSLPVANQALTPKSRDNVLKRTSYIYDLLVENLI